TVIEEHREEAQKEQRYTARNSVMSVNGGSVFSRLSKRSAIRDKSQLALHLSNDNAMRRVLRDGVGINEVQKKYLSLCYSARPAVRPNKDVAQGLGSGELVWNLTVCEKPETAVVASLLTTKEARSELRSLVISADEVGCSSVRKRAGMAMAARRGPVGSRGGSREMAMERDPVGQIELFVALCKALPRLNALRSLELQGLTKAFEKSGAGAARLARGLAGNARLKSLAVRRIRLADARALGVLSSAIGRHPSLLSLSLEQCGLAGETSGHLVSSVIRAHAARREGMVWSAGLRRPAGVVKHTVAAAPVKISTAGCLAVDLSRNHLGDAGVHAVARGLQSDTWLLGLNLADNEITDRGAALLSMCLQHNATLCALVLDGNKDISRAAVKRITGEMETRSTMPQPVLEEPEVVLTLASWGFSAHVGFEGDLPLPPPPPPAAADSDSAVSDISHDSSGGGGGGRLSAATRRGGVRYASAVKTTAGLPQTPAERKREMIREFTRWAGYTPCSMQRPAHDSTAAASARAPTAHPGVEATIRQPLGGRGRRTTSVLLQGDTSMPATATAAAAAQTDEEPNGSRGRARARSLSSRSAARAAGCSESSSSSAGRGRLAKRTKSSGPFGRRAARERSGPGPRVAARVGTAPATAGACGTRTVQQKAPWGAGPGKGYARARAQAWAEAHLAAGDGASRSKSSAGAGSRRSRARTRRGYVGASGCCGGHNKVGRRPAKSIGSGRRTAVGNRRGSRRHSRASPPERGRVERQRPRGTSAPASDVTWDVLDAQGYAELTPRHRKKMFSAAAAAAGVPTLPAVRAEQSAVSISSHGGRGGGARGDGRTDRVVEMMASLEQAVMDVCKDMWRLEDKVEGSQRFTASGYSERTKENLVGLDGVSAKYNDDDNDDDDKEEEGEENNNSDTDDDDLEIEGRDDIAAQVEFCLQKMWREALDVSDHGRRTAAAPATAAASIDDPESNIISGSSAGIMAAADLASHSEQGQVEEGEHEQEFLPRTHPALLSNGRRGGIDCSSSGSSSSSRRRRRQRQGAPMSGEATKGLPNAFRRASELPKWGEYEEE
ncbi:unnamed protein product, partial [Pylaiella littoralis]